MKQKKSKDKKKDTDYIDDSDIIGAIEEYNEDLEEYLVELFKE